MPELKPIGERNVDELDFEPLTVPIIGYTLDKKKVTTKIRFLHDAPVGAAQDMIRSIQPNGRVNHVVALDYIDACVYPDDRQKWEDLLHSDEVFVGQQTIADVYTALGEFYANRPSMQRSGSAGGPKPAKRTTRVAAKSRASTSKRSR